MNITTFVMFGLHFAEHLIGGEKRERGERRMGWLFEKAVGNIKNG